MTAWTPPDAVRSWNGPGRIHGVDLARGLAVLGMLAAHLLEIPSFAWAEPTTWTDVVNGRSSILFATLAGVSIATVTGRERPLRGGSLSAARLALAVRAGLLWLIGFALILTGVPVYVILPAYAILFVLALPLLRAPASVLWAFAVAIALTVPWMLPFLDALPIWGAPGGSALAAVIGWHYPFVLWAAFLFAGMALGRSVLTDRARQVRTLVAALAVWAVATALETLIVAPAGSYVAAVWRTEAHSGGILEVFASGGFAVAVLMACLLVCRTPLTWVLLPLRAVGTMALTAYVGQIVAWAVVAQLVLGDTGALWGMRELQPFGWFALVTLVGCTAWALLLGRGPLERAVSAVTSAAVGAVHHR